MHHPEKKDEFKARIRILLYHEAGEKEWRSKCVKFKPPSGTGEGSDAMFEETCTWAFDADELAFIRCVSFHES